MRRLGVKRLNISGRSGIILVEYSVCSEQAVKLAFGEWLNGAW